MGVEHLLLEKHRVWNSQQLCIGTSDAISKAGVTWERQQAQCSGAQLVGLLSLGSDASSLHSSKLFKLFGPQFSHYPNGNKNSTHWPCSAFVRIPNIWRCREQRLAHGRCLLSVSVNNCYTRWGCGAAEMAADSFVPDVPLCFLCRILWWGQEGNKRYLWISFTKAITHVGTLSQGLLEDGY